MSAFGGFVRKETFHILRDWQTLLILLFMPLVQLVLFGFAVRTDVRAITLAIVDPTPGAETNRLVARFRASDRFRVTMITPTVAPLDAAFRSGAVRQAIVLPDAVDRRIGRPEPLPVQLITDASDPNTGNIMQNYAAAVIRGWHAEGAGATAARPRVEVVGRMRFNPTLESVNLFVPGLIALILTIVSAMMTAISITREKEMGTMEMLLVSPLRPWQIVAGKVAPYIALGFFNVLMVVWAARVVFGMPLRGSLVLLLAASLLYIVTALSIGIVISSRAETQRTAMIAALAGLLMPTMVLSGFIFPIDSLPLPLQMLSNLVPARWFLVIVRGIMVKGAGLQALWQETLILIGLTTLLLTIGARRLAIRLG